jgi:hypothetical protein
MPSSPSSAATPCQASQHLGDGPLEACGLVPRSRLRGIRVIFGSATVTSTAVPKYVGVVINRSSPRSVRRQSGTANPRWSGAAAFGRSGARDSSASTSAVSLMFPLRITSRLIASITCQDQSSRLMIRGAIPSGSRNSRGTLTGCSRNRGATPSVSVQRLRCPPPGRPADPRSRRGTACGPRGCAPGRSGRGLAPGRRSASPIGGCVARRQQQRVSIAKRHLERLGEAQRHPASGLPATALEEADVPLGRPGTQGELELAYPAVNAPSAQGGGELTSLKLGLHRGLCTARRPAPPFPGGNCGAAASGSPSPEPEMTGKEAR